MEAVRMENDSALARGHSGCLCREKKTTKQNKKGADIQRKHKMQNPNLGLWLEAKVALDCKNKTFLKINQIKKMENKPSTAIHVLWSQENNLKKDLFSGPRAEIIAVLNLKQLGIIKYARKVWCLD